MTVLNYQRFDLPIIIRREEDDTVTLQVGESASLPLRIPETLVEAWDRLKPGDVHFDLYPPLQAWQKLILDSPFSHTLPDSIGGQLRYTHRNLSRFTLDIQDYQLAALPWEAWIQSIMTPQVTRRAAGLRFVDAIVRVSAVVPRVSTIPLTYPIRFLQVNPIGEFPPKQIDRNYLGMSRLAKGVQIGNCSFEAIPSWQEQSGWPRVDVLHFDQYPFLDGPPGSTYPMPMGVLSTSSADVPGTAGWLARRTDFWQTRLIVFRVRNDAEAFLARQLVTRLLRRGGPAGLIIPSYRGNPMHQQEHALGRFYSQLIRDSSLDVAYMRMAGDDHGDFINNPNELYIGAGRAELLRVSDPVNALKQWYEDLPNKLESRSLDFDSLDFFDLERGLLPMAEWIDTLRRNATTPVSFSEILQRQLVFADTTHRHVNAEFFQFRDGKLKALPQETARLLVGQEYQLGIQIGPKAKNIVTIDPMALHEEVFKWTPEIEGVWLDVSLVGLDFEVVGEPVQTLWLPRDKRLATKSIYFAVIPKVPGVARLRFCIFYNQDILHAWRISVLTKPTELTEDPSPAQRQKMLAMSLDLTENEVPDVGFLARLEYSISSELVPAPSRQERALSIVANEHNGDYVIAVKGLDTYDVRAPADLDDQVKAVRDVLEKIATDRQNSDDPRKWLYRWDPTYPQLLKDALCELADAGWELYTALFKKRVRDQLALTLANEKQIIHVAHILVEKVIPWAMIYDREFDGRDTSRAKEACLASLPLSADGGFRTRSCGEHPNCLLRQAQDEEERKRLSKVIACPLHFLGFKHIIELPPQQTKGSQGHEQRDCTRPGDSIEFAAAFNQTLHLADSHFQKLESLIARLALKAAWSKKVVRNDIKDFLNNNAGLDFIYFYCHANDKDEALGLRRPYLEFQESIADPACYLTDTDLAEGDEWESSPLVFLNGCRTAGFSPRALSPFIVKLVQDRGASGVIGTEIYTWEQLAVDFSQHFLEAFFSNVKAGEALLIARRKILADYNPLGLIYTLYASADLRIDLQGKGNCD